MHYTFNTDLLRSWFVLTQIEVSDEPVTAACEPVAAKSSLRNQEEKTDSKEFTQAPEPGNASDEKFVGILSMFVEPRQACFIAGALFAAGMVILCIATNYSGTSAPQSTQMVHGVNSMITALAISHFTLRPQKLNNFVLGVFIFSATYFCIEPVHL